MKKRLLILTAGCWAIAGASNALVIIGGSTGNGNFSAGGAVPAGAQTYDQTPNWYNGGGAETINFTQDDQMGGSTDPDPVIRGGMPFNNRLQMNDSSYTVTNAGEVFSISYEFGAGGGTNNWAADDTTMRTFLFTSTATVDGSTTAGDIAELGGDDYPVDRDAGQWTARSVSNFYTTSAADIGKTVYFGMQFEDISGTPLLFPRIDLIQLEVAGGGGTTNPPAATTNIIGGVTGNGDFEASETPGNPGAVTGPIAYDSTVNWHNASGVETINFTQDTQTSGSSQADSRAGMPFQERKQVNDTGYTVLAAGQTFDLSYEFGRVGGGWDGDESMRTFLFTATAPVDGVLDVGDMSEFGSVTYTFPTNDFWTTFTTNAFYTAIASDVGKTFYFGMEHNNPAGANVFPRLDLVVLDVNAGTAPPTNQPIIVGGTIGNGDFEASETPGDPGAVTGPIPYDNTVNWHNASGDETLNFTQDTQTSGSSQSDSRAGMPFQNRKQVNDSGHTVAATGEVFNLSYELGRVGGGWSGDEQMRTFLFTTAVPVDGSLGEGDMSEFVSVVYTIPTNDFWTTFSTNTFYTSTASDVGKTFYLGMELLNPDLVNVFPRIDLVQWDFQNGGGGTNNPPVLTAWEQYIIAFGLSGDKFADADSDGEYDYVEFAHGGNPTNAAQQSTPSTIRIGTNVSVVSFISLETSITNPGVYYNPEWTDNLVTGEWKKAVGAAEIVTPSVVTNFNVVERQFDSSTNNLLFLRNRLSGAPARPNILFILADDLGYADVGFNGSPDILTPELDVLAAAGTRFTSAYVVHPFCGPSRMGLMSGRYPHEFGGPFNLPNWNAHAYRDEGISTSETLFSTALQSAGYRTGIMGKWHMGEASEFHPNARGFDDFYGFLGGGKNYFGPYQQQLDNTFDYTVYPQRNGVDDTSLTSADYITDVLSAEGVRFINESATNSEPFFLFMSYNAPHTPLQAKAADMAVFPGLAGDRLTYAGMVYALDRGVGALIDALQATGQYNETLIIFLSDNGGRTDQGANNAPLRGVKGDAWEGGFRVPMFMHWPGVIPAGVDFDHPVTALDFYPTFTRLAAADIPAGQAVEGKDIWDAVLAGANPRAGEPIYAMRYRIGSGANGVTDVGIRQDQWKASRVNSSWRLYNISTDIHEDTDLSGSNPTILSNLVSQAEIWSQGHVTPTIYDSLQAEADWITKGMPHYDITFTIP